MALPLIYSLNYLGLIKAYSSLSRRMRAPRIPILTYHRIGDTHLPWQIAPISTRDFKIEIDYLKNNYEIVSLSAVVTSLKNGLPLPRNGLAITFDGYYKDNFLNAYPILKKYHIPAALFLFTGSMDSRELFWEDKLRYSIWQSNYKSLDIQGEGVYNLDSADARRCAATNIIRKLKKIPLAQKEIIIQNCLQSTGTAIGPDLGKEAILTWDEVREMGANGFEIGAHTVSHPILSKIPLDQAEWEITESKRRIEEEINKKINLFAYPNGGPEDYNADIIQILKKTGFSGALINSPPGFVTAKTDLFKVDRINASADPVYFKFSLEVLQNLKSNDKKPGKPDNVV